VSAELLDDLVEALTTTLIDVRHDARVSGRSLGLDDEERVARDTARAFFDDPIRFVEPDHERDLTKRAVDLVLGCGPLQALLDDPDITDIHARGSRPVWVKHRDGRREQRAPLANSDDELIALVRTLASRSRHGERRFDASTAECNLCLPDGSRLFAVMDVATETSLVVRKHQFRLASLEQLMSAGLMSWDVARFLRAAVLARRNIVVVGGTGSGKTTLMRALINEIPVHERIVTIEDAYELGVDRFADLHPDHDALQTRGANVEGHGAIDLASLTRMALRMDPDRVIVGEVRGAEAFPMVLAMSQGNNGSMCTLHADSTRSAFSKLAAYVSMADTGLPIDIVNLLIANAVHVVVHVEIRDGVRRITGIREVVDADGPRVVSNELFAVVDSAGGIDHEARAQFPMTTELAVMLARHGYGRTLVTS
jgi:Flp pilus assembly CpaF family ATPase